MIQSTKLVNEDGYLVYRLAVNFKGIFYTVLVDAGKGKVLEIEMEDK
jgi:uncharacterized membrane protein YkoI